MGKWIRSGVVALAAVLIAATSAAGADKRIVNLNLFTQNDLRALAMGNAFGAIARGETALFYNPAGLAQFNFDLKAEYSAGLQGETGNFAQDTYTLLGGSDVDTATDLPDYLAKYEGSHRYNYQLLMSAVANLAVANVGFGAANLDSFRYTIAIDNGAIPDSSSNPLTVADDTIAAQELRVQLKAGGAAYSAGKGKVLFGIAGKSFQYGERIGIIDCSTSPTSCASGDLEFDFTGPTYPTATAYDVGMLYRLEFWAPLKPQWSLTAFNVGGVTLEKSGAETLEIPASYNVGFAFGPDTGIVHWLISAEVEDVTNALKVTDLGGSTLACDDASRATACKNQPRSLLQRSHFGAEIGLWRTPTGNNILNLRAGNNRGYFTYGWEVNLWALRILYAKGADNLGWEDNVDKFEFTAYQVGIALAW